MKRIALMLLGVLLLFGNVYAQRTITGKILDEKNTPIPYASVKVKGSTVGTSTDGNGFFSLNIPSTAKALIISAVGMAEKEVAVTSNSQISVNLSKEDKSLEEVVITGYGRERKSRFTGSATVIGGEKLENTPVGAFDQAFQGRAAGVLVNSGSGQPGTSPTITIRGIQSITGAGAQPLYVVDGIPIPAGDMATINPNDFESYTILKDASAAAKYGARSALGVIVITTKRGKAGATNFSFRSQVGYTEPPKSTNFDMMNTQEILQYEERLKLANTPGWTYSKNNPTYATLPATTQARYDFMLDSIGKIDVNYKDYLFRNGFSQSHEIDVSGGTDKSRFYISAGYFDQKGTDLSSALKRYTTRFNFEHTANRFNVQFNNMMGYSITNFSEGEWLGNSARNSFQMSWRAKPYENPYKADGTLNYGANTTLNLKQIANVLEGMQNSLLRDNQIKLNSGLGLSYKILDNLTLKNLFGIDVADDRWQRYINPVSYIGTLQTYTAGINSEAYKISANLINTTSLVYNKRIGGVHEIEAGAFFEVVRGYQKGLGFTLYNLDGRLSQTGQGAGTLPTNGATTATQNSSSAKSGFGIRSYFGTLAYTYMNKVTVNASIRRDGTSRILNEANKEITTYAVGANWNIIKEEFMRNIRFLNDLNIRASYGSTPNIGSIATSTYGVTGGLIAITNYLGPQLASYGTTTGFAGSATTGIIPTTAGNPNLKIETVDKFDIGFDAAFWNNRAKVGFDIYEYRTKDLFVNKILGATSGFGNTTFPVNAGTMSNKGIELTASVDVVRNKDWTTTLNFNHSISKNKIVSLGGVTEYFAGTFLIREGLAYGSHYTYHYLGADAATGKPRYETLDGKETNDIGAAGQFAKFGTYFPKHTGGFGLDVRFKNLSLTTLFSYQFDVVRSNNIENWVTRGTPGYHTSVNASRRLLTMQWQKAGDDAFYQAPIYDRGFTSSDLQDAKFLRFRNIGLTYNVPRLLIKDKTIIKSAKIYVQGHNLVIWSPWRGPDPEDNNNISLNEFPNPRMIVGGIQIGF